MELIKAKKKLGQNFLVDSNISKKIVSSLNIEENDEIVEIGPGTGALTQFIIQNKCSITALEVDDEAIKILNRQYTREQFPNFELIKQDVLKFDINEFYQNKRKILKIIGNIPYYLTTELFFKLYENSEVIDKVILMVQKEIAMRLVAKKSTKDYGILTLAMELSGKCKKLFDVNPGSFVPKPNVMSSVIEFDFKDRMIPNEDFKKLMPLIRAGFNQRRKTLRNALTSYVNQKTGKSVDEFLIDKDEKIKHYFTRRAEELMASDYILLNSVILGSKGEKN